MSDKLGDAVHEELWTTDAAGRRFRDLNGNGRLDPYEDATLPVDVRVDDLVARMTVEEKAGLLFHPILECGPGGDVREGAGAVGQIGTTQLLVDRGISHVNVHALPAPTEAARWVNALQRVAASTRLGIPITVSTDPRHAFAENSGVSFAAAHFSQWPEGLGLGAIDDPGLVREFAEIARAEYVAVGLRAALHPVADLATEPRWARQYGTFGQRPARVAALVRAALEGFQGIGGIGAGSVACTTKHFPGGGPQADGEDPHFPYGQDQIYPGGRLEDHLLPFREAIAAGTSAIMPYYGRPIGLTWRGRPVEEVAFGFNRQIVTEMLREDLGFDGVVLSDWELVHDVTVSDGRTLPARAWGVEHLAPADRVLRILEAGCDQLGGESCPEIVVELVRDGRWDERRLDVSVRRLLRVKFELGLFDDPFVDEDAAAEVVGAERFRAAGRAAQSRSVTVLSNSLTAPARLPLPAGTRVWGDGVDVGAGQHSNGLVPVEHLEDADVAIVKMEAPYTPRNTYFLEDVFLAGTLEYAESEGARLRATGATPTIAVFNLNRPALVGGLVEAADTAVVTYGVSDAALADALTGRVAPRGVLPFDLPESASAVEASRPDVGGDTPSPVFRAGHGLMI